MTTTWTPMPLAAVLQPVTRTVRVDAIAEYDLLGIRLDSGGPFLREKKLGSEISATTLAEVKSGDFIYSRLFAWRGAFGIITPELDGCFVSKEFPTFVPRDGLIDVEFLNYWLCLPGTLRRVDVDCSGSTPLTRNRYKEEFFLRLKIPLPLLSEQRRIVAKVEELAAKIEEAKRLHCEATAASDAILQAERVRMFSRTSSSNIVCLEAVCESIIDTLHSDPVYSPDGVPCVRSPDINGGRLNLKSALRTTEEEYERRTIRSEPRENDIVYCRQGGATGRAAVVNKGDRFSLGQAMMILRPNRQIIHSGFLHHQLLSPTVAKDQLEPCFIGTASPRVNIGALRKFRILLPPVPEQLVIAGRLTKLEGHIRQGASCHQDVGNELDALLPSILDRAFRGEL